MVLAILWGVVAIVRLVLTLIFFLILPGYMIALILFPQNEEHVVENVIWSLTLSMIVPPMLLLMLHYLFQIPINITGWVISVLLVTLPCITIYLLQTKIWRYLVQKNN